LLGQLAERFRHLVLVGFRLGLDCLRNDRLGELDRLENQGPAWIRERIAREGVLQAYGGNYVARHRLADFLALVRVHSKETAEALLPVAQTVEDRHTGSSTAGVDSQVGQPADIVVADEPEY